MAGNISALVVQKQDKKRVNIFVNGEFALAVSLDVASGLRKGQHLSDRDIAELKLGDQVDRAYQQALSYLGYRARSKQEMRQYLQRKNISVNVIESVIDRLVGYRYLDDADFGRLWVENRVQFNPKGKRALHFELRQKGLNEEDITMALMGLDEETLAYRAVAKKLELWKVLDQTTFRKKLIGYLARRGFNHDTIKLIFDQVWQEKE